MLHVMHVDACACASYHQLLITVHVCVDWAFNTQAEDYITCFEAEVVAKGERAHACRVCVCVHVTCHVM